MRPAQRLFLYGDALRHARPHQLLGRTRRLVPPSLLAPRRRAGRPPLRWEPSAAGLGADPAPPYGQRPAPQGTRTFAAYGARRALDAPGFWNDPRDGLLFLFHLHGFADLAAYAAGPRTASGDDFWAEVIGSWLATQSRPRRPAWHPYPTSMRLIAWAAAISSVRWNERLVSRIADELWRQGRFLRRAVEHDIGGNHVLRNAKALVFAGAVLPESGLLDAGLRLFKRELPRQVLADGGHEERSTSYHRQVAHDIAESLEVVRRLRGTAPDWMDAAAERTSAWQAAMAAPDLRLPLLNDAWDGPGVATRDDDPVTRLSDSGYLVLRHGPDQATFDHGPMCPPHLPPHAHADTLAFTLWIDGRPLLVDPGSYAYTGTWRAHFRATAAHNTVEVDGEDQCVFWGDFRAARHPRTSGVSIESHGDVVAASSSHDGYRRLRDPVVHHRTLVWIPAAGVVVVDRLAAADRHRVRSSLHVAPEADVHGVDRVGPLLVRSLGGGARVVRREDWFSPALGTKVPSVVIEDCRMVGRGEPFGWSLLREGAPAVQLSSDRLVVTSDSGSAITVPLPALSDARRH